MMNVWENVKYGLPIAGVRIIDVHGHCGEYNSFFLPKKGSAKTIVELLDNLGVECAFLSANIGFKTDHERGNRILAEAIKEFPGRIYGYVCLNPTYMDDMVPELEKYKDNPGFKGIKFHISINKTPFSSPKYAPALKYADEHGMVVLMHTYGIDQLVALAAVSDEYKNAKFIAAHSEVGIDSVERIGEAVNSRSNFYVDTALAGAAEGSIELLAKYVDTKKILYGTDIAFYSPNFTFGRIALADIDDEAKLDILGRNAEKLFGI
ncbi:MAG: amidohydrolase [Oscillospiraceae bacterium]|nr:amidohydrolase [Oscillospiraceae bacterium]